MRDSPVELGSLVSKYRILKVIGCGGCAWVFQARDDFLGRDVAIKILHCKSGVTPEMLQLGQAEAQLLIKLRHANIVETFDAGMTENGLLFIVMELLVGRSLLVAMHESDRMAEADALGIFLQAADAMTYAHALGAIHLDLKPENIFVTNSGDAKVLDFGIAKIMVSGSPASSKEDGWFGTLLYMSPEQVQCVDVSFGSDIYSLGMLFWEVLGRVHPLLTDGEEPLTGEIARLQVNKIPPSIHEFRNDISEDLSRIIDRAISKLSQERYPTMSDFANALRECDARRRARHPLFRGGTSPLALQAIDETSSTSSPPVDQSQPERTRLGLGAIEATANRSVIGVGQLAQRLKWHQALLLGGLMGTIAFGIATLWLVLLTPTTFLSLASIPTATIATEPFNASVPSLAYGEFTPLFPMTPPKAHHRTGAPPTATHSQPDWSSTAP